ncbi:MAG: PIN domain-containing protein [Nanoarchaeota archaeon]
MKIVVDANVLFSLCKPDSTTNLIFNKLKLQLFAPYFALRELAKYKNKLLEKSREGDFKTLTAKLKTKVSFLNEIEYKEEIEQVEKLISDPKDIAYLAPSIRLNASILSDDPHFKEQNLIQVFTTKDLIFLL